MTARGNEPAPGLRGRFRFVALIDPGLAGLALRVHVRGSLRDLLGRLVDDLRRGSGAHQLRDLRLSVLARNLRQKGGRSRFGLGFLYLFSTKHLLQSEEILAALRRGLRPGCWPW